MCSDCEAYGLKKHGVTRSDMMFASTFAWYTGSGLDGRGNFLAILVILLFCLGSPP